MTMVDFAYNTPVTAKYMDMTGVRDISTEVLQDDGYIKLLPFAEWEKYTPQEIRLFCHKHARYGLPTVELVQFIKNFIAGRPAIEIGAGHGDLGHHLGIPQTDLKLQEREDIQERYAMMGQPVINYPATIKRFEALDAVYRYKPKVVVSSWITPFSKRDTRAFKSSPYGVREEKIVSLVENYITVGNLLVHYNKPVLALPHHEFISRSLVSRTMEPDKNRMWIWGINLDGMEEKAVA